MQGILKWLTSSEPTKEIEDDWCLLEELEKEKEEDIHSSTCTIEPVITPNLPVAVPAPLSKQLDNSLPKLTKDTDKTSVPNLQAVVENRILELQQGSKLKYQMRNDLAQIKDKELKYRKLQKLQKRS
jgi:hypothetical protein